MATWNSGAQWNSNTLWGPVSPSPSRQPNLLTRHKTVRRQPYYPKLIADQPEWHLNYADQLQAQAATLGLDPDDVSDSAMDSRQLGYALGVWLKAVRDFGPGCTAELDTLRYGTGNGVFTLPTFVAPPPLTPLTPVKPGALNRIFKYVQTIKSVPAYTEGIGLLLGIVGEEDTVDHAAPEITLKLEQGTGCQCVKVRFKKYGHYAVAIYSRRNGGDWALLGIAAENPFLDERPLATPGQPEMREYRARFWDSGSESGDWTDIATVTVGV